MIKEHIEENLKPTPESSPRPHKREVNPLAQRKSARDFFIGAIEIPIKRRQTRALF